MGALFWILLYGLISVFLGAISGHLANKRGFKWYTSPAVFWVGWTIVWFLLCFLFY